MIKVGDRLKVMADGVEGTGEEIGDIVTVTSIGHDFVETTLSERYNSKHNANQGFEWSFYLSSIRAGHLQVVGHIENRIEAVQNGPCTNHTWNNYVGFTQAYEYCTHCDKKRNA